MRKLVLVAALCVALNGLLGFRQVAAQHSIETAIGMSHFHEGMEEFRYIKPTDPHLNRVRSILDGQRMGYPLWPENVIPSLESLYGIPSGELESITLATTLRSGNARPFLVLGKSRKLRPNRRPPREYEKVSFAGDSYFRWKNDSAFTLLGPDAALHGTESDIKFCMGKTKHPTVDRSVPGWEVFQDPTVFFLQMSPKESFIHTNATGVRFSGDGFEIRRVRVYRDDIGQDFIEKQNAGFERDFLRSNALKGLNNKLTPANYAYDSKRVGQILFHKYVFKGLTTADHWRQAVWALQDIMHPFAILQQNYLDSSVSQKNLLAEHSKLQGISEERELKRAISRVMLHMQTTSRLLTAEAVATLESVYVAATDVRIVNQLRAQLKRGFSKPSLILNDRIAAAGDSDQAPPAEKVLRYYILYGDDEACAAACRIAGRTRQKELIDPLKVAAQSAVRDQSLRATAVEALIDMGQRPENALDVNLAIAPEPIQLPNLESSDAVKPRENGLAQSPRNGTTTPVNPAIPEQINSAQKMLGAMQEIVNQVQGGANLDRNELSRAFGGRNSTRSGSDGSRRQARNDPSNKEKIREYLAVLRDPDAEDSSHQAMLHRLQRLESDPFFRKQIFQIVGPLASHSKNTIHVNALRILEKYGFESEDDELLTEIYQVQPASVFDLMAKYPSDKVLAFLFEQAKSAERITDPVFRAAKKIGPRAEPVIWPVLQNENPGMKPFAIQLLGEIGTKKSIEKIRAIEGVFESFKDRSIEQIRLREKAEK